MKRSAALGLVLLCLLHCYYLHAQKKTSPTNRSSKSDSGVTQQLPIKGWVDDTHYY